MPSRNQSRRPEQVLDELRAALSKPLAGPDAERALGGLVRKYREALGIKSAAEFAKRVGVTEQTVFRWERGQIGQAQLRKLDLVAQEPATSSYVTLDSQYLAIRPFAYILARQHDAKAVWILRSYRRFLSGYPSGARFEMVAMARANRELNFNFVFPSEPRAAQESFRSLQQFLQREDYRELAGQFHGITVQRETAQLLGLGIVETSTLVIEYQDRAFDTVQRERDIFIETPVAILIDPAKNLAAPNETQIWTELPVHKVDELWMQWQPLLEKAKGVSQ